MELDYNSLLLAVGFSAAGLAVAILSGWLLARTEGFMVTWAGGLVLIVISVLTYSEYVQGGARATAAIAVSLLVLAFATLYGAAVQFTRNEPPFAAIARVGIPATLVCLVPGLLGYDGIALFFEDLCATLILIAIAVEYWRGRREAPMPIYGLATLYTATGLSFALCGLMIVLNGEARLSNPPSNWAENLSLLVCLIGLTGIGALSLALSQWRISVRHRQDALTDSLTGLLNRRAVFEIYGAAPVEADTVVVVFDLDHFKSINDRFGHALGDEVLRRFAGTLLSHSRSDDRAARLGGEEFALVLPQTPLVMAVQMAELVRRRFAEESFAQDGVAIQCTVSAGVAEAGEAGRSFEAILDAADRALYLAKSGGRDRIVPASLLRAG